MRILLCFRFKKSIEIKNRNKIWNLPSISLWVKLCDSQDFTMLSTCKIQYIFAIIPTFSTTPNYGLKPRKDLFAWPSLAHSMYLKPIWLVMSPSWSSFAFVGHFIDYHFRINITKAYLPKYQNKIWNKSDENKHSIIISVIVLLLLLLQPSW